MKGIIVTKYVVLCIEPTNMVMGKYTYTFLPRKFKVRRELEQLKQ